MDPTFHIMCQRLGRLLSTMSNTITLQETFTFCTHVGIHWKEFCHYWDLIVVPYENGYCDTPICILPLKTQSTLVISKSKGPSKTLRDIHTSTYQICSIEKKNNLNNQIFQMTM